MTPSETPKREKLMTPEEVADRWKCSVDTVKRSGMAFTRIGVKRRYHPKVVERYELARSSRPDAWKAGTAA